jgi:hypothetical protein
LVILATFFAVIITGSPKGRLHTIGETVSNPFGLPQGTTHLRQLLDQVQWRPIGGTGAREPRTDNFRDGLSGHPAVLQSVVESDRWYVPEVECVVSAEYAFIIEPD